MLESSPQLGDLLDQVRTFIGRFVVLPSDAAATVLALFVLHTWAIEAAEATAYIVVVSAEKGSGKTRVLEVLGYLVREPWHTAGVSEAALFRKIEQDEPCLLLDEVDAIFGSASERTEPLRAALNAGNRRGGRVTRCVPPKMELAEFSVFCPKALAGIDSGRLPDTTKDRSVILHMKRRRAGEKIERLRHRNIAPEAEPLTDSLRAWAEVAGPLLRKASPELPDELSDRAGDGWEPLLAIADLAGEEWAAEARQASVILSAAGDEDELALGPQLLAGIRRGMDGRQAIGTADLLALINADEELPFGAWNEGKGIEARRLARLLKPYGIKPKSIRMGDGTPKGYALEDLQDAFARYLPEPQQAQRAQPAELLQPHRTGDVADVAAVAYAGGDGRTGPARDADGELARIRAKFGHEGAA
jgi:hypothetical protein